MSIKKKLLIAYLMIGVVWSIINLPNLLEKAKGSPLMASLLATARIVAWPVFVVLHFTSKGKVLPSDEASPEVED